MLGSKPLSVHLVPAHGIRLEFGRLLLHITHIPTVSKILSPKMISSVNPIQDELYMSLRNPRLGALVHAAPLFA